MEKGAGVSASPRVAGLSAARLPQGRARAFHRRHARPAPARVAGFAFRTSFGQPPDGRSPGRARSRRTSFPPRCPLLRLCLAASASRFRSSRVADPEGSSCLDGLARSISLRRAATSRAFGHLACPAPKRLTALKTRSALARRRQLRVRSPGSSMLRGSISRPGGPSFLCRSMRETFWTPDPFRFHPTRSRERDRPFPGVASPYRHAWLPEGTCPCRPVVNF